MNEQVLLDGPFKELYQKLENNQFVIDKTGAKMVELVAAQFNLNPIQKTINFKAKQTTEYAKREIMWYDSRSLYVDDIPGKTPKIWKDISDKSGKIHSNYGWCIYSDDNYNQYNSSLNELKNNKESRRACMIYNRPSMQIDYNTDEMNDFMCTFATQQLIRDNKLEYIVEMRSNDSIFGFINDLYWHTIVYNRFINDLNEYYDNKIEFGNIIWKANSFHVYERHFDLLKEIVEKGY